MLYLCCLRPVEGVFLDQDGGDPIKKYWRMLGLPTATADRKKPKLMEKDNRKESKNF